MKLARLAVLGVALSAGLGAAYFMMGEKPAEPVRVVAPPPPPPVPSESVLVASRNLTFGAVLVDADMRWQDWPKSQVPQGALAKSTQPNAILDLKGSIVRANISAGEPLRTDRLIKGSGAGFLSAVLPTGLRAVAVDLSDQGRSAAGGFILPNDHVDVIRTFQRNGDPGSFASETILTNIRVLAIGQNVQDKVAEKSLIGGTATLELTAAQAEKVVLAQRTGQLTLSLRSITDAAHDEPIKPDELPEPLTIIRSGNASQSRVR